MSRTPKGVALTMLLLAACVDNRPFEQRYSADELRAMLEAPQPRCERYGLGGWTPDLECERGDIDKRARIREALLRRHAADVAGAPACVRQYPVPPQTLRKLGADPESTDAIAELIIRGLFIGSAGNATCAAAVCEWRTRNEPTKHSPFCNSS